MSSEIIKNLLGPSRSDRLVALNCLHQEGDQIEEVVKTLLSIENVPSTITDYRDRERYLEDAKKILRSEGGAKSETAHAIAFSYLVGSLYINFEKFWGPTVRVIIEILNEYHQSNELLQILLRHLKDTNDIIYNEVDVSGLCSAEDRPDHILHRNFIFQILAKFPQFIEKNNQLFMDEFFRFVNKEMLVSPFIERYTKLNLLLAADKADLDLDEHGADLEEPKVGFGGKPTSKRRRTAKIPESILMKRRSRETFITVAKIISTTGSRDKIHRSGELKSLLLDLLCCRDGSIQRAAFNCLLIFERECIAPYVERLMKILNEKRIRSEITSMSFENDLGNMNDELRTRLVPILLRILFGKMLSKIGKKSQGRDKSDQRKALVMRFISFCSANEILYFFTLLFEPIIGYIDIKTEDLKSELISQVDIKQYVPLNKLQAMLGSLSAFMKSVAHLKDESLHNVLKLINILTFHVVYPLETEQIVKTLDAKTIDKLKALRRECTNVTSEFFRTFEYYHFSQNELNYIFELLVWPSTDGFVDKNHANIGPALKLIETFASHKTYHKLLIKRNKIDSSSFLLRHIIDLFVDSKTSRPVMKYIATMIANILTPDRDIASQGDFEVSDTRDVQLVSDEDAVTPTYDANLYKNLENIPFNQEILVGFIPQIFNRMKQNCQEFLEKKDSDYRIENDELHILSVLSKFLKESEQSCLGARLLLSTLAHQKKSSLIMNTLQTSQSLLKQVDKITDPLIVQYIADMLGFQRNMEQRNELCNLVEVVASTGTHMTQVAKIVRLMNAMSEDLIESSDLVKWNEGFRLAFIYIDSLDDEDMNRPEAFKDPFLLLIHQVGFIIGTVDKYEFSIRENCAIFFERLAKKLNLIEPERHGTTLRHLIDDIILDKLIKKGFRETNEVIKHTSIAIARNLAIHCHRNNSVLKEFHQFCDDNQDLDFWINIKHIQLHNRSKALARLIASDSINNVSPRTLSSFFMPIAAGFLFSKNYKSVSSLSENSIKLIGIVCKHLNWITYESTLSYYLGLLTKANATYQNTNIRLITEILKNFNFDLTACDEAMQFKDENTKLEKRMKRRRGPNQDESEFEAIIADVPSGKRLNPSTAKMVYYSITKKILPRLNSCLHEMTKVEFEHDKNMAEYLPEKAEIKRISIAYAIVQLLNLLPGRYVLLRDQLPGILLKLTSFLKSKSEQIRKASRQILIKVMSFVGPIYLSDMLRVLRQNLEKGFQIHVLNYTIHSVLVKIPLHYGDLDHTVDDLVDLCYQEIYGKPSEDKEIAQILAKTPEAKKTKSYDTLLIISSYIGASKIDTLMKATFNALRVSNEPRKVNKLSQCLQRIFTGLSRNDKYPLDKLFVFIQKLIEDSLPNMRVRKDSDEPPREKATLPLREDRYLIVKNVRRGQTAAKINEKGNYHLIVENSLRLLLLIFEKNKSIIKQREAYKSKLDAFVRLLATCLKSSSPRCVMRSLKCIYFIGRTKSDSPTFKTKCNSIVKKIFVLLNLYNGVGMAQGDNFEMIQMCFKTLTLLLLRCEHVKLTNDQVRALISYIEQDIHDTSRQGTAFATLHSILEKGCECPELAAIMTSVADLLVTSDDESVRSISTKIWKTYLLKYGHDASALQAHLTKFMRQIDYEHIQGRKSILRMLTIVVAEFPEHLLRDYFELIFQLLSQRVVNEESKEIRADLGKLLGRLISRLPDQQDFLMNKFVLTWAAHDNDTIKLLGVKLLTIFLESCPSAFEKEKNRVKKVLGLIAGILEETSENQLKLNYHTLRLFQRLLNKGVVEYVDTRYISHLKRIWHSISAHGMNCSCVDTVITACQLYLKFIKETGLSTSVDVNEPKTDNYLDWNAKNIVLKLCDNFIDLLDRSVEHPELRPLYTEGLILLGQILARCKSTHLFEQSYENSFPQSSIIDHLLTMDTLPDTGVVSEFLPNQSGKRFDLMWLSVKIVMQARKEVALNRLSESHRRNLVLQWTAAVSQDLGAKRIPPYAFLFVMTPVRELTDKNRQNEGLLLMSQDLLKFIKSLLGLETFNKIYSKVQLHYTKKRVDRKRNEAVLKVKDQVRGVKRKLNQRKQKSARKKRVFSK